MPTLDQFKLCLNHFRYLDSGKLLGEVWDRADWDPPDFRCHLGWPFIIPNNSTHPQSALYPTVLPNASKPSIPSSNFFSIAPRLAFSKMALPSVSQRKETSVSSYPLTFPSPCLLLTTYLLPQVTLAPFQVPPSPTTPETTLFTTPSSLFNSALYFSFPSI